MQRKKSGGGFGRSGSRGLGGGIKPILVKECICPKCHYHKTYGQKTLCHTIKCPKCGTPMTQLYQKYKRNKR